MSGRVRIIAHWPSLQLLFYDFVTGDATLLPAHRRALQRKVYPIIRQVKTRYNIVGSASNRGDAASINRPLSWARANNILRAMRREARYAMRRMGVRAMGESVARGGPNANRATDRSVAISLLPAMEAGDATDPMDEIRREFQRIINEHGIPPPGISGEERARLWNPLDARLSGFGASMRSYLMDLPSSRYSLIEPIPRGPFAERVRLHPRRIRNVRSRIENHNTGQGDALDLWRGFTPDQRWAIKREDRTLIILCGMCEAYRRSWAQHYGSGSSQAWRPGMCGFVTAAEEQQCRGL